jgi:hypothetical protein
MPRDKALTTARQTTASGPVFSVERANRALVYVRRVVADIVARYRELNELHEQPGGPPRAGADARLDACVAALDRLQRELLELGCVLKDWRTGLVDFPAVYDGRRVWLCWRLGEAAISHWHELESGFSARQPVGPDFV